MKSVLITGGAGFIGSNFVRYILNAYPDIFVVNLDKLTYAGVLNNLSDLKTHPRHLFIQGDICDAGLYKDVFSRPIQAVINFAAESHVDRSILDPEVFLRTNVYGTGVLLDATKSYWGTLDEKAKSEFRYLQISTDEVYGSLAPQDPPFTEESPLLPNSPYAAGKAGGDHVVRAYQHTYGVPTLITRCSNNYGPHQFPEKLIPLMINHILEKRPLPVYGDGTNVRDWIHVLDHCEGIDTVWHKGKVGEIYNIGGQNEWRNIDIVHGLCDAVDDLMGQTRKSRELITFVKDRLGHDQRYALNIDKTRMNLGWFPKIPFDKGLKNTVAWYMEHQHYWKNK